MIELAPSILSADFAHLADQVARAAEGGGTIIHVDVMDGHFVPNITLGPQLVWISVHVEACRHLDRTLNLIKSHDCHGGVVINPATPVEMLSEVLDVVDYVLVMSVNPGFGAQPFIPNSLHKLRKIRELREQRNLNYRIEVDGGVALDTVAKVVRAGAEILVAGNAVFSHGDPMINAQNLLKAAFEATLQKV
ncbi:MAG: ribulose-phosphate 3-epimerase [Acidobacteria bacterium]|nr:MAG: ribulose-phosphate 3-epimerase [Acidobacteriota bacterium]